MSQQKSKNTWMIVAAATIVLATVVGAKILVPHPEGEAEEQVDEEVVDETGNSLITAQTREVKLGSESVTKPVNTNRCESNCTYDLVGTSQESPMVVTIGPSWDGFFTMTSSGPLGRNDVHHFVVDCTNCYIVTQGKHYSRSVEHGSGNKYSPWGGDDPVSVTIMLVSNIEDKDSQVMLWVDQNF